MRRKQYFHFKKFLNSNILIIIGIVVLILLGVNLGRTLSKDYLVKREIKRLEGEVKRLEAEQKSLVDFKNFMQTDFFIEQESRKSLGYVKPGEKVIIIEQTEKEAEKYEEENLNNPQKWWRYFFGSKI